MKRMATAVASRGPAAFKACSTCVIIVRCLMVNMDGFEIEGRAEGEDKGEKDRGR